MRARWKPRKWIPRSRTSLVQQLRFRCIPQSINWDHHRCRHRIHQLMRVWLLCMQCRFPHFQCFRCQNQTLRNHRRNLRSRDCWIQRKRICQWRISWSLPKSIRMRQHQCQRWGFSTRWIMRYRLRWKPNCLSKMEQDW